MEHDHILDVAGMCCAEPIIRITKHLKALSPGEVLLVVADKSSMRKDVPAYCHQTGHELIGHQEADDRLKFWIRKRSAA